MVSSRTHYKIQTLSLIVNYHSKNIEDQQKTSIENQYSDKDRMASDEVERLISQLRMNKLPRYTVNIPHGLIQEPLNTRN